MIETPKETLAERKRKRREYLEQKQYTYTGIVAGLLWIGLMALLAIGFAYVKDPRALVLLGPIAALGIWTTYDSAKRCKGIPYVPPVSEQLAALPAEEILVRGSEKPTATPGELLRAANRSNVTAAEELLRPKDGEL